MTTLLHVVLYFADRTVPESTVFGVQSCPHTAVYVVIQQILLTLTSQRAQRYGNHL